MARYVIPEQQGFCCKGQCFVVGKLSFGIGGGGDDVGEAEVVLSGRDLPHLLFYLLAEPDVVLVGNGDKVRLSLCGTAQDVMEVLVAAFVGLVLAYLYGGVLGGILAQDVHRAVGGAVVLDDDFMDGIGLCQDGVQLFPQEFLSIVGTHYDGYGCVFHWIMLLRL